MTTLEYGAAQVELSERTLNVTRVGCKFSRVKSIEQQHFRGRAARAVVGGRLGGARPAPAETPPGLRDDNLARRAIGAARVGAPTRLAFPASQVSAAWIDHA